jgi:hypothetical protein
MEPQFQKEAYGKQSRPLVDKEKRRRPEKVTKEPMDT